MLHVSLQAYQWTRPIPTSLKIIHTRVYAQASRRGLHLHPVDAATPRRMLTRSVASLPCALQGWTLAAMAMLAGVEMYGESIGKKKTKSDDFY